MKVSQKLQTELPYDLAIPLLGIYLKKTNLLIQKDTCTPIFIVAVFIKAKIWKQPQCPSTDEWINMWCVYTHTHIHNGILLSHKKGLNFAITWMHLQ